MLGDLQFNRHLKTRSNTIQKNSIKPKSRDTVAEKTNPNGNKERKERGINSPHPKSWQRAFKILGGGAVLILGGTSFQRQALLKRRNASKLSIGGIVQSMELGEHQLC